MNEKIIQTLNDLLVEFDDSIFSNSTRFYAALLDILPGEVNKPVRIQIY